MVPVHTALARLLLLEHRDPPGILPGSSIIATFSLGRSGDHGEDDPSLAPAWKSG
jgi:hypothetical protein